jgi:HEPN pEK499 p136
MEAAVMEYKQQFERDFMRRTLELVRTYHGSYDSTNLLNCLLGLLIVPKETSIDKVPDEPIADLGRWGISPQSIESFGRNHPKTLRQVVWSLRNAVAHFRFEPVHEKHKCIGFRFHDQSGFKATIKNEEMRIFVEKLAKHLEREASA